jgi:hypothetical protein
MGEPTLIIEVSRRSINAGVFSRSAPRAHATEALSGTDDKSGFAEALGKVMASLKEQGFEGFEKVYLSIPPSQMSLRPLTLPFKDKKKIDSVLPFELSGTLPMETNEAVFQSILLGGKGDEEGSRVLAVTLDKAVLSSYIEALSDAGLDPAWIGSALFSIPGLLKDLYSTGSTGQTGAVTAYICKEFISVSRAGMPLFFNSIHDMESLKLNLGYLASTAITLETVYWEGRPPENLKALFPEGAVHEALKLPEGADGFGASILAVAGDIRKGLGPGGINLRRDEFEYTRERTAFKRRLRLTFALAAVIIAIFAGDLYLRYKEKAAELSSYSESIKSSYLELFPNERGSAVTGELYLLKAKLKELDRTSALMSGGTGPLDILGSLTKAGGAVATEITLHEASIGGGRIKARGTAASFEAANDYKEALAGEDAFTDVLITDVKSKGKGEMVAFSLTITIKGI